MLAVALLSVKDVVVMRAALPRFSRAALVNIAVIAITGLYRGWRQVETLSDLVSTSYGQPLLAKAGPVAAIVGIAAARSCLGRQPPDVFCHHQGIPSTRATRLAVVGADRDERFLARGAQDASYACANVDCRALGLREMSFHAEFHAAITWYSSFGYRTRC